MFLLQRGCGEEEGFSPIFFPKLQRAQIHRGSGAFGSGLDFHRGSLSPLERGRRGRTAWVADRIENEEGRRSSWARPGSVQFLVDSDLARVKILLSLFRSSSPKPARVCSSISRKIALLPFPLLLLLLLSKSVAPALVPAQISLSVSVAAAARLPPLEEIRTLLDQSTRGMLSTFSQVREGRNPCQDTEVESAEACVAEVMLIVQVEGRVIGDGSKSKYKNAYCLDIRRKETIRLNFKETSPQSLQSESSFKLHKQQKWFFLVFSRILHIISLLMLCSL